MANILVVEDLHESFVLIKLAVDSHHQIFWAESITKAKEIYSGDIDLILLDVGLPDGDGFEFCYWVRTQTQSPQTPIIFVSGRDSVENRIAGFSIGGDDYISKPFNIIELKTRLEAKLRRLETEKKLIMDFHGVRADLHRQTAQILHDGILVDLDLTPLEFKILNLLLNEPNKVLSRDEILNRIWGQNVYVYPRSVDTHVSKLRKKLQTKGYLIKSVHGVGYRLCESLPPTANSAS